VPGDRRTLRPLSPAPAGSGTGHGALAGALRAVVAHRRLLEADERTAKAAIYGLNRAGGRTRELEEAWIIQALVREDGMSPYGPEIGTA
jgi:hypothetical protein